MTPAALALARLRKTRADVFRVPDGRVRFVAATPIAADLLAEARRHQDEIAQLLASPVPIDNVPDAPCPACDGRLWVRRSVLSGGPGPWQCRSCDPLPADVSEDATAIPILTRAG